MLLYAVASLLRVYSNGSERLLDSLECNCFGASDEQEWTIGECPMQSS